MRADITVDSVAIAEPAITAQALTPAGVSAGRQAASDETHSAQTRTSLRADTLVAASAGTAHASHRRMWPFALTTNMLYDLLAVPDIGLRIPFGSRFVAAADWMFARWSNRDTHRYWRIYGGNVELLCRVGRIPSHAGRLAGHHLGVYASLACYDFQLGASHSGVMSDKYNYAAGLCYAYSMPVAPRLNIEFSLGVGYQWGYYKKHRPIDNHDVWLSTHRIGRILPTRAGISLVWMLGGSDSDKNRKGGGTR